MLSSVNIAANKHNAALINHTLSPEGIFMNNKIIYNLSLYGDMREAGERYLSSL